ncbi:MAG: SPOR domain-containing protein [Nitrospirae bacterium]|nr:SPOR domain-containing protein [Nitrospirota bacterium]
MANKAILVIDSDTETAQAIVSRLESEDYLVFIASTAEFGIIMARRVKPALIFINPAMPGVNALDLCKTIHGMAATREVPIVALSSEEGERHSGYYADCGIVDTLRKPFTPDELVAKTTQAVSSRELGTATEAEGSTMLEAHPFVEPETAVTPEGVPKEEDLFVAEPGKADRIIVGAEEQSGSADYGEAIPNLSGIEPEGDSAGEEEPAGETLTDDTAERDSEKKEDLAAEEDKEPFVSRRTEEYRKSAAKRLRLPIAIIAVSTIIVAVSAVMIFKKDLIPGARVEETAGVRTPQKPEQKAGEAALPQVGKLQQPGVAEKPAVHEAAAPAPSKAPVSPTPAPEAVAQKQAGKPVYSVQLGAFMNEKNAEALVNHYKKKGYEAFLYASQQKDKVLHRVLIGKFEDRKEAAKLAAEISSKEGAKVLVTRD